jgi:hypothetical protein
MLEDNITFNREATALSLRAFYTEAVLTYSSKTLFYFNGVNIKSDLCMSYVQFAPAVTYRYDLIREGHRLAV